MTSDVGYCTGMPAISTGKMLITLRRMKRATRIIAFLFLIAALVAALAILWQVFLIALLILRNAGSSDASGLVLAALAGTFSVVALIIGKQLDRRSQERIALRNEKSPLYKDVMGLFYGVLTEKILTGGDPDTAALTAKIAKLTEDLTIWGSDEVLKEFGDWKKAAFEDENPTVGLLRMEKLFYTIRKDLGHKNKSLKAGDILRMFVNNLDMSSPEMIAANAAVNVQRRPHEK